MRCCGAAALAALLLTAPLAGQSTLERTPNLSGGWVGGVNVISFNFVHRFNQSGSPQRQVQSRPTFLLGYTLPLEALLGVSYTTRSALTAGVPNEWQPFARVRPSVRGVSVGLEAAWNEAARSFDGEISLSRALGPIRPLVAGRVLSSDAGADYAAFALAGGAVIRLHEHIALAADAGRRWSDADDDRVFWGAGLQLRIPQTPHTLSLQATNTDAATLQAASRASGVTRWGFEFTIPFTPSRYFGSRASAAHAAAADTGAVVTMRTLQFSPARLRVPAGTRVEWHNEDPLDHTVTAADGSWDSGSIAPGTMWSRVFETPGTYQIVCTPHPFMKMEVIVE
jgi:plastocyanin